MPEFESSRAVIVGINGYGNGVPALCSAVNDAQDLAKILKADHGYAVTLLVDGEATRAGLKQCFEDELPDQVGADGRVLVYFAGHGIAEEGDDGPTGYLLPQDARPDDRASFLPMETFRGWLGRLRCRHLLVILDCCFAGAFRWTKQTRHVRAPLEVIHRERYERFIRNPAWQAIASTACDQEALDTIAGKVLGLRQAADNTPNSPFARALFEGLKGKADLVPKNGDRVIVGYELATFLQDSVSRCADDARHEQMPCIWSLGKEDSGQFVFLLPNFDLDTLKPAPVLDAESNPYRGLSAYEEKHAGLFFGRDKVVEDLAAVVRKQPLTMVLGASGTGKSSLVRAGLLAYPRKLAAASGAADAEAASDAVLFGKDAAAEGVFHRLLMRPADAPGAPLRWLVVRLSTAGGEASAAAASEDTTEATPTSAVAAFGDWFAADPQRHLLIVIDQFEELVTLCAPEVRTAFLDFLADLIDRERDRLRIVLTLRSDFEPQFQDSALRRYLATAEGTSTARFLVPPMQHHEFRETIEKPASERVLFFEPPALVDRLITEVIQMPGALPLLSFALSELYLKYLARQTAAQQRGQIIDRTITEEDYRQLGGVVGALSKRATEEYDACDETHRRTMQRVMLRMVATEGELARRRVPRGELIYPRPEETERAGAVVERLEKARLVVSGRTDGDDGGAGSEYVEPAHDALVRAWGKLLDWQREAAAELPVQRRLTEAVNEWQRRKRDSGLLWTVDPRLALVRQQLTAADSWLNARETEFVTASTRRKRRNTRLRAAAIAGLVLLTLASAAAAFIAFQQQTIAFQQQTIAERERDQAERNQSRAFDGLARIEMERASPATALRVALVAVPQSIAAPDRAYARQAEWTIWDVLQHLHELRRINHEREVNSVAFSPDGKHLATGSRDNTARVWEVATGKEITTLRGHEGEVSSVAFSPDGKLLATGSEDKTARLWEVATGKEITTLRGHEKWVTSVAFSPDGQLLATGSEDKARLWKVATGKEITALRGHHASVFCVAFSPDGKRLATGSTDNMARLWEVATGKEIIFFGGHESWVSSVAFSPDGTRLATGSEDSTARLWDVATGRQIAVLRGHEAWVSSVVFSPDGKHLATGSRDKTARVWEVATGKHLWEETTVKEIAALRGHEGEVRSVAFSPDGERLATGSWDKTARLWEVATGKEITTWRGHEYSVNSVAFSPDGKHLATGSRDKTARVWEVATGKEITTLRGHEGEVSSVAFSPDGTLLATGSGDKTVRLWEVATGKEVTVFRHEGPAWEGSVASVAFSPDGQRLATGSETARLWEVATGKEITDFRAGEVSSVAFSPDGTRLATGSYDNTARLWEVATGKEITAFRGHEDRVLSVAFSPDGKLLATGSYDNTARLWEVATGKEITAFRAGVVVSVAFSPDGQLLATGSQDNTARLWEVATGKEITTLRGHEGDAYSVVFSPDGTLLATGSGDGTVRLLRPVGQGPVDLACARVHGLPLSEPDKERFGIDKEWCTPEVSAALRAKLGLDTPAAPASTAAAR